MKTIRLVLFGLLCFGLPSHAQVFADFENWHQHSSGLTSPNGWNGSDSLIKYFGTLFGGSGFASQIQKELPGNGSATAMKVITVDQPAIGTFFPAGPFPGLATNGKLGVDMGTGEITISGGMAFTSNPTQVSCWVKNFPVGGDTTEITVFAIDDSDGDNLQYAIADTLLTDTISNFTKITLPFKVTDTNLSTTLLRVLVSSTGGFGATTDTYLVVDDMEVLTPNGVYSLHALSHMANVYPSHVQSDMNVIIDDINMLPLQWKLFTSEGACVQQETITQQHQKISCNSLPVGNYFYQMTSKNQKQQVGKILKVN